MSPFETILYYSRHIIRYYFELGLVTTLSPDTTPHNEPPLPTSPRWRLDQQEFLLLSPWSRLPSDPTNSQYLRNADRSPLLAEMWSRSKHRLLLLLLPRSQWQRTAVLMCSQKVTLTYYMSTSGTVLNGVMTHDGAMRVVSVPSITSQWGHICPVLSSVRTFI